MAPVGHEIHGELRALEAEPVLARSKALSRNARITIAATVVVVAAGAGWFWHRSSRVRWALGTATPEIARLVSAEEFSKAAALLQEARAIVPNDPTLEKLWRQATTAILSRVSRGSRRLVPAYRGDPNAWESLGQTPVRKVHVASDIFVWRTAKPGFATAWRSRRVIGSPIPPSR